MRIVLFSNNKKVREALEQSAEKGGFTLEVRPSSGLKKPLRGFSRDDFVYVDVAGQGEAEIGRIARLLEKKGLSYGFVDPGDRVRDVAHLFHLGASDFIGGKFLKKGIDPVRLERGIRGPRITGQAAHNRAVPGRAVSGRSSTGRTSARSSGADSKRAPQPHPNRKRTVSKLPKPKKSAGYVTSLEDVPPAVSWGDIEEEKEYVFCLMYIELDNLAELRKSLGEKNILLTIKTFREYVGRSIAPHSGRLWMWNEFSGLALFPFDGFRCEAVTPCIRLMLASRIFSADLPFLGTQLSYRIALHIGNTVYRKKGDTGGIVSDALNSVFHLGRKFLKPGNFYITKEVYDRTPECLKQCFLEAGVYDGSVIMRMRLPR